jgi:hypothetical protein
MGIYLMQVHSSPCIRTDKGIADFTNNHGKNTKLSSKKPLYSVNPISSVQFFFGDVSYFLCK